MRLEDALRFNGYVIAQEDAAAFSIPVEGVGSIAVPAMRRSKLVWSLPGTPEPVDSFYLEALPVFDPLYQPVLLSQILDRFSTRRIGYDMPDMFGLAVRRWLNLNLGATSVFNRLYTSTAYDLPLTTQDSSDDRTVGSKSRDAHSDFPQGQLSGNLDYASDATDQVSAVTDNVDHQGRQGVSVMALLAEQRAAYLNVDEQVLDAFESVFLGLFDQDEKDSMAGIPDVYGSGYSPFGFGSYPGWY